MPTSALTSSLAYAFETTQGAAPANAAAWVTAVGSLTTGARIRHISESLQIDAFKQPTIEDMRSQENVMDQEQKILGIKGGIEFGFDAYLTGTGVVTAAASQVDATALSNLLGHCFGGQDRSNSTTISAGSSTTATVAATTNINLGSYVGIEDTSAADGLVYLRRVVDISGSVLTFDEALPFAVASGDVCHGAITIFLDEDALEDSSLGPTTLAWHLSRGRGSAREQWVAAGCKAAVESISLPRNEAPKLSFKVLVASFTTPEANSDPTWVSDPLGNAPLAIGPATHLQLQTYGTTTQAERHALECSFSPGCSPTPMDTLTEVNVGMPGRGHYGLGLSDTTAQLHTLMSSADYTAFNAGTLRYLRWSRVSTAGRCIALAMSRAELVETPAFAAAGPSMGAKLAMRGLKDTTSVATTALWRTRMAIVIA